MINSLFTLAAQSGLSFPRMKGVTLAPEVLGELRRSYLFADADDTQLASLCRGMRSAQLQPGDVLFRFGEPATRFYFVRTGQIKLYRVSPDGHERIIDILQAGQTFAEAVMFMGAQARYPVSSEAITEADLYAFDQKSFLDALTDSREICFSMLAGMSRRLHGLVNQIDGLTLQNGTYRLVMYLLEMAPREARPGAELELTTPKATLAARLAIQPETFSRLLGKLRDQGLIEVNGSHIILRDLQGLRELVYLPAVEPATARLSPAVKPGRTGD
jgi:CRP-like cAMP-binding protein